MALNDDLSGLIVSYLDITDYTSQEITQIISCMGCDRMDKVLNQWNKSSDCETIFDEGTTIWMVNKKCHRTDGPAVELVDGDKEWWVNDQRHRIDGPAVERANGDKEWWMKGQRHRVDGPAIDLSNGNKEWWVKGGLHRTDGPAVEDANGDRQWWVDGKLQRHAFAYLSEHFSHV